MGVINYSVIEFCSGQQQDKNFDVTEIFSQLNFAVYQHIDHYEQLSEKHLHTGIIIIIIISLT